MHQQRHTQKIKIFFMISTEKYLMPQNKSNKKITKISAEKTIKFHRKELKKAK